MHGLGKTSRTHGAGWSVLAALLVMVGGVRGAHAGCASDGTVEVAVKLSPPSQQDLAGVKVILDYPENAVTLPGFENQNEVKARVMGVPDGFLSAPNDTDTELIMAIAGMGVLPASTIFSVDFDHCKGQPPVRTADFHCDVKEASTPKGELVAGSSCTVTITFNQAVGEKADTGKDSKKRGSSK